MPVRSQPWPEGTPCWVDCQVDDPATAGEFYAALFGWTIEGGDEASGGYLMGTKDGGAAAGIGPKPDPGMRSTWTSYFAAGNADAIAEKAHAAGGQVLVSPFDVLDAGRMAVVADTTEAVFGIWQARTHIGAAVHNEHGAYCWSELRTRELATAKRFYADVFGLAYSENAETRYVTFSPAGGGDPVGGMSEEALTPGTPSHWLAWFRFDDVDAGVGRVRELGGQVLMEPVDSPYGRMGIVVGPQGESFGIVDTAAAVFGESGQ
ncbi:VOC family protein [Actinomadura logoneensis]|uniref:VOC family protein n=1 Tax=Actinomadura logoneensis TaxID=2293572 RepID=A0A372JQQ1_9ACTN|nr:VOC family protein [Actinomadura logoneensis]RFU42341.1 VOC family protein [Actinomadura logoneensis]